MPHNMQLNPGDQVYKYQLKQRLGGGGFGDVWLAHDKSISRDVAVKVLVSNATIDERLQEARIGNHLNHQNLVKMHYADVVQHNNVDIVIIAMDYHTRGSILADVNAGNFIPIPHAIGFIIDILRGLEYLHELNLYHGDIKPQNILIGSNNQGVLTDYGITCHSPSGQPVPPRSTYKLHVAPEVLNNNQINVQTDLYQVGLTAFRLFNGIGLVRERFNNVGQSDYYQLVRQGKVIRPEDYKPFIPRNLKSVINKAIHVDPANRYKSAVEMRRALERLRYMGYWTCNPCGVLQGYNNGYEYRFDDLPRNSKYFDFTAYKKNVSTGRETRISDFSAKNVSRKQVDKMKTDFMQWVVIGK